MEIPRQCNIVGFHPVYKKEIHKDFPLDPKTGTTRLIFHYMGLSMLQYIYIHVEPFINPNPLTPY